MRVLFLLFTFGFLSNISIAQTRYVKGSVVDGLTDEPLIGATIFFNGTTVGTATDINGNFSLPYNELYQELVVSYIGYETITYRLQSDNLDRKIRFQLEEKQVAIDEVVLEEERSASWYNKVRLFKTHFIGRSKNAYQCDIENIEVLYFNEQNNVFSTYAREPIIIINNALGYKIEYLLEDFIYDYSAKQIVFMGYPRFTALEGSKRKQKKWAAARRKAYYGSSTHFFYCLYHNTVQEEGFRINEIISTPNPDYPSEEEINWATPIMKTYFETREKSPTVDSARAIIKRKKGIKYNKFLNSQAHPYQQNLSPSGEEVGLSFNHQWQVTYLKEVVDANYIPPGKVFPPKVKGNQVSILNLIVDSTSINSAGFLSNPLDVLVEQYWSFEKIAELLPMDYRPEEK